MKKSIILALFLCLALLTAACGRAPAAHSPSDSEVLPGKKTFARVSYDELPQEIKAWVDVSREMNLAQEKVFGNRRYILVTYGIKPTGGYTVEIQDVEVSAAKINVTVKFNQPTKDQYVTDALTQPYDIIYIEPSDLPVEFFPVGDEYHVMTLMGIDELAPITASSPDIKIFTPAPGEKTGGELTISGVANVYEGTVLIRMEDSEGSAFAAAALGLAGSGDWYYFDIPMLVSDRVAAGSDYYVVIYTESPKDGSEENVIKLPLKK